MKNFAAILLLLYASYKAAAQNDCVDAITVCGSMNYTGLHATGFGVQEIDINNACFSRENNSIWFKLKIKNGGTLGFILSPESNDIVVDYDFWIFGPNIACGVLGDPIRCSTTNPLASGGANNLTGMNDVALDDHEGPSEDGDQFVKQLDVQANDIYYLLVDRPHGDANFSIQWTGTATFFEAPFFDNPLNISLDMGVCDTDGQTDGHFLYDLTIHRTMLIGAQDDVALTYHLDSGDAITGDNPIPNPQAYTTIADPQVIHMRMTNTITGCYATQTFIVDTVRPDFINPQPIDLNLHACDDDGIEDGFHVFNLAQHQAVFMGSRPHVSVKYYETEANAYAQTNHITVTSPYVNTSNPQTFYIRLNDSQTGCYNVQPFTMTVHPLPVFQNPSNISLDLSVCDHDGTADGNTNIDLTQHWTMLTGGDFNLFIKYYEQLGHAQGDVSQITNPFWYQNLTQTQTIYMRLEDINTGCFSIASFTLEVKMPPVYNNPSNIDISLRACDNGSFQGVATFNLTTHAAMLTGGQPNLTIKYYREDWEATWDFNALTSPTNFTNGQNPQTIYMRLEDSVTGCMSVLPFTVAAIAAPLFRNPQNIPLGLSRCDNDGTENGKQVFDLTAHEAMFATGQPNVVFSYHTSASDAEGGLSPIGNPATFANTSNPQIIYVRARDIITGCYNTSQFTLTVNPLPQFNNPQPISLDLFACDPDSNGFADFDLTQHRTMLVGGIATRTITYYRDSANAEAATNAITNPEAFTNTSQAQMIYMRLDDLATGCHRLDSFTINTILPPAFNNPLPISLDLAVCDDASNNGLGTFDLTQHQAMLLNGRPNLTLTYHLTDTDALAGINPINNPAHFDNTINPQVIHMRLTTATGGCHGVGQFTIWVNPLPVFNNPQQVVIDLEECDADNADDQSYVFNLNEHVAMLRGNQQNISVTFHTNVADAESGNSPVPNTSAFRNTSNPQTVYMRFINRLTGCHAAQPFTVTVVELLDAGTPADLYLCDENEDGHNLFDLRLNDAAIKNGQAATLVTYYRTQAHAQAKQSAIGPMFSNEQPYVAQTLWARLDNAGGCWGHDIKPFTINIMPLPDMRPTYSVKDFTVYHNSITVHIDNSANYLFSLDGVNYQESPLFDNLMPGLYKVFIMSRNECKTIDDEVVILNYPKFFSPNDDGYNELWHIPYLHYFPKSQVYIFDRYGKLITGFTGKHPGWDGTYNGRRLPATDYWFVLELEDGRVIKSHFSLIR